MLLEVRDRVDEALKFDDASNAIEAAEFKLHRRKDVECREPRELVAVLGGELTTKLALWWGGALGKRTLARDEEQVSSSDAVRVVSQRGCWPAGGEYRASQADRRYSY